MDDITSIQYNILTKYFKYLQSTGYTDASVFNKVYVTVALLEFLKDFCDCITEKDLDNIIKILDCNSTCFANINLSKYIVAINKNDVLLW